MREDGEEVQRGQVLAELDYFKECQSRRALPILALREPGTRASRDALPQPSMIVKREEQQVVKVPPRWHLLAPCLVSLWNTLLQEPDYLELLLSDGEILRIPFSQKDALKDIKEAIAAAKERDIPASQMKKLGFRIPDSTSDTFLNEEIALYPQLN